MQPVLYLFLGAALLNAYALVLVLLRAPVYKVKIYKPMLLNIGLSLAPAIMMSLILLAIVGVTIYLPNSVVLWAVLIIGGLLWLLLLPNAAYLITELNFSHRKTDDPVPLWYDIVAVLTLALSGVINTIVNVFLAQILALLLFVNDDGVTSPSEALGPWFVALAVLILVSVGIYLGRYIRFNSWDLVHPVSFVKKLFDHFASAGNTVQALGFIFTHALLLTILYLIVAVPILIGIMT